MATKSAPQKRTTLPPLTGIQQQVIAHVMNSIAFENYGDCCTVEAIAEVFKRAPNRFLPTLRKLESKGYIRIEGEVYQQVYPTRETLQKQNPHLTEKDAQKILRKIHG